MKPASQRQSSILDSYFRASRWVAKNSVSLVVFYLALGGNLVAANEKNPLSKCDSTHKDLAEIKSLMCAGFSKMASKEIAQIKEQAGKEMAELRSKAEASQQEVDHLHRAFMQTRDSFFQRVTGSPSQNTLFFKYRCAEVSNELFQEKIAAQIKTKEEDTQKKIDNIRQPSLCNEQEEDVLDSFSNFMAYVKG